MKKRVIYLSGPIANNPDFADDFDRVAVEYEKDDYYVINPAYLCCVVPSEALPYEDFMKIDFMLIDRADILVLLPGWEDSPGCNRELGYAQAKGKTICVYTEMGGHFGEFKGRRP